jgi:hypothetical protein
MEADPLCLLATAMQRMEADPLYLLATAIKRRRRES